MRIRDLTVGHQEEKKLETSWELALQMGALRVLSLSVGPLDAFANTE